MLEGALPLDQVVKVRILAPQPSESPAQAGFCLPGAANGPRKESPFVAIGANQCPAFAPNLGGR
jgi:hypothetical protein